MIFIVLKSIGDTGKSGYDRSAGLPDSSGLICLMRKNRCPAHPDYTVAHIAVVAEIGDNHNIRLRFNVIIAASICTERNNGIKLAVETPFCLVETDFQQFIRCFFAVSASLFNSALARRHCCLFFS